jgi:hypothetical protein
LILHHYLVKRFGFAAAAVLGLLDFWDRSKPRPGMPLASRSRIIADLEGVVGRDAVDRALKTLLAAGIICKIKNITPGEKNLAVTVEYALDAAAVARETEAPRDSWNQEPPGLLESGLKSGLESGSRTTSITDIEVEAEVPAAAAAPQQNPANPAHVTGKQRRVRPSGIVTWTSDDVAEAERLEKETSPGEMAAAVQSVRSSGKESVPGLVAAELERMRRRREAEAAAQERRSAAAATPPDDPDVIARGQAFLEARRRLRRAAKAP